MNNFLDFEKPIADLEGKIRELEGLEDGSDIEIKEDIAKLRQKALYQLEQTYTKLTPWQKTQVARHVDRPKLSDITAQLITDFTPLAGDRAFADDHAIVGEMGAGAAVSVTAIGDTVNIAARLESIARPQQIPLG